ncbi:MAG: tyrosine-type recombinase/integrase [Ignavibacteriae bacterium]|nr:tyrosine-type recombinase/integrase [Ignavibacteriota bacterium]
MATIIRKNGMYFIQYWLSSKRKTIKTKLAATEENFDKVTLMKNRIQDKVEIKRSDLKYRDILNSASNVDEKDITIAKAEELFKLKLTLTSKSFQDRFRVAMNNFNKIVPKEFKANKVTFEHSLMFVKLLMDQKLSNASIRTYYEHIKMMFQFLVKHKYLHESPLNSDVLPRKSKKAIITFDKNMLDDILSAAKEITSQSKDESFYNILMLLLLTGLRPKDLIEVKTSDINFAERCIHINISKTDKEIHIPMSQKLYEFISKEMRYIAELDSDQHIFPDYTVSRIGRRFRRLKSKLGIKEKYVFTLKTFRKSFATHYARGLDIQDVAYLLGHDEVATTKAYYSKILTENVRSKMDNFDEAYNKK